MTTSRCDIAVCNPQELIVDKGLKNIATYADAIGPDKGSIVPLKGGQATYTTDLIQR